MEQKKNPKADLKNSKAIFFEIGMIAALAVVIAVFGYNSKDRPSYDPPADKVITSIIEIIPVTEEDKGPAGQQTVMPKNKVLIDLFEISRNNSTNRINPNIPDDFDIPIDPVMLKPFGTGPEVPDDDGDIVIIAERMPRFRNGDISKFRDWVNNRITYPEDARLNNIQGVVTIRFVVDKYGKVKNIEVVSSPDPILSAEVIKVLASSPKWEPGYQRDQAVNVQYHLPIEFRVK